MIAASLCCVYVYMLNSASADTKLPCDLLVQIEKVASPQVPQAQISSQGCNLDLPCDLFTLSRVILKIQEELMTIFPSRFRVSDFHTTSKGLSSTGYTDDHPYF